MSIDQNRAKVTGRIWQAIGESGVSLQSIPKDQVERLVDTITDSMLLTFNDLIGQTEPAQAVAAEAAQGAEGEQTLWEGRPFLSISEHYLVTTERIRITRGLFGKDREDIELFRLQDIDQTQKLGERMFNIGDITLRSADASHSEIVLHNVSDPLGVHEIIRRAMLDARQRYGVRFRDEM